MCSGRKCSVNLPGKRHQVVVGDRTGDDDVHDSCTCHVLADDRRAVPSSSAPARASAWRDDRGRERVLAGAGARAVDAPDRLGDRLLRGRRVLHQVGDDQVDRHRVVVRVPAVVVGDQRERRVADLRLARELGLLQVRHADDVHAPRAIQLRLGQRRELRPFHVHVGAAAVDRRADRCRRSRRRSPTGRRRADARTRRARRGRGRRRC